MNLKDGDIEVELCKEGDKYRLYGVLPFGREKKLVATFESQEFAYRAYETFFTTLKAVYGPMEDAVTQVAYKEATESLKRKGIIVPSGDIYPEQLVEQTNILVELCIMLTVVALQNADYLGGGNVWWEE